LALFPHLELVRLVRIRTRTKSMKFFNSTSTPTSGIRLGCPALRPFARVAHSLHLPTLRRALAALTLCAFTFLLTGCSDQRAETPTTIPQPQPAATSTTPSPTLIDDSLAVTGPLIVEHQVDVTAQREGIVASISAD